MRPTTIQLLLLPCLAIAAAMLLLALLAVGSEEAEGKTITVNKEGGADYENIQDGIDAAETGDTVSVAVGKYQENVVVNKSITLSSPSPYNRATIDGGYGTSLKLYAADVIIGNFLLESSENSIEMNDSSQVRIVNCTIMGDIILRNSTAATLWDILASGELTVTEDSTGIVLGQGSFDIDEISVDDGSDLLVKNPVRVDFADGLGRQIDGVEVKLHDIDEGTVFYATAHFGGVDVSSSGASIATRSIEMVRFSDDNIDYLNTSYRLDIFYRNWTYRESVIPIWGNMVGIQGIDIPVFYDLVIPEETVDVASTEIEVYEQAGISLDVMDGDILPLADGTMRTMILLEYVITDAQTGAEVDRNSTKVQLDGVRKQLYWTPEDPGDYRMTVTASLEQFPGGDVNPDDNTISRDFTALEQKDSDDDVFEILGMDGYAVLGLLLVIAVIGVIILKRGVVNVKEPLEEDIRPSGASTSIQARPSPQEAYATASAMKGGSDTPEAEFIRFVEIADDLLGKLPEEEVTRFAGSPDFELYRRVVENPSEAGVKKHRFISSVDRELELLPGDVKDSFTGSAGAGLYMKVVEKFGSDSRGGFFDYLESRRKQQTGSDEGSDRGTGDEGASDFARFVGIMDDLLGKIPDQEIERFTDSPEFEIYRHVVKEPDVAGGEMKDRFIAILDRELRHLPDDWKHVFADSGEAVFCLGVVDRLGGGLSGGFFELLKETREKHEIESYDRPLYG